MASVAVMVNTKRALAVMAFPAEFALLDGFHGYDCRPFFLLRKHILVMAFVTFYAPLKMLVSMEYRLV
jgi:hypothetical protein